MASISKAAYDEYRQQLQDLLRHSSESFDKAMLTLSGGALALSLTFLNRPDAPHALLGTLARSWACFAGALLATVLSFRVSAAAMGLEVTRWDDEYQGKQTRQHNPWNIATRVFNVLSIVFFAVGTVLLVVFASANVVPQ